MGERVFEQIIRVELDTATYRLWLQPKLSASTIGDIRFDLQVMHNDMARSGRLLHHQIDQTVFMLAARYPNLINAIEGVAEDGNGHLVYNNWP